MKRAAILIAMAALISAGAYAATITPQRGGGIGQFDGGVSSTGTVQGGGGGGCTIDGNLNFATKQCNMIFYMTGVIQ